MILRYASCIALTCGALSLVAQPTLTTATSVPAAGTDVPVNTGNTANAFISAGADGENVTYNYWDILSPSNGSQTIRYVDPAVTPTSALISNETLLKTDGGTDTLFLGSTAQGLETVGARTAFEGTFSYTDAMLELKLPCTYQTTWSDPFAANYTTQGGPPFGGLSVTRVGTITGTADAYGTLTMPWEITYPEVLRVRVRRSTQDNSTLTNVTRISNVHYFYIPTLPHPVLTLIQDSTNSVLGWTITKKAEWTGNPVVIGMDELDASDFVFNAYPSPAADLLNVNFAQGATVATRVELYDAAGRVVRKTAVSGGTLALDTKELRAGLYTLRVLAGEQVLGMRRVAVE